MTIYRLKRSYKIILPNNILKKIIYMLMTYVVNKTKKTATYSLHIMFHDMRLREGCVPGRKLWFILLPLKVSIVRSYIAIYVYKQFSRFLNK